MDERTCSVDGCDGPHRARGLCAKHYNEAHRAPRRPRPVACIVCGRTTSKIEPRKTAVCSTDCRSYLRYGRWPWEGKELVGQVPYRKPRPTQAETPRPTRCRFITGWCRWCGAHFIHDMRTTGVAPSYCQPRCARRAGRQRYYLRRGVFVIPKKERVGIYERDSWTCQLCGTRVDPDLPSSDDWAASLDHIECQSWTLIPDHSERNLRLAHRLCNSLRGDREDDLEVAL